MKHKIKFHLIVGLVAIIGILAIVASCDLFGTSISARVDKLASDLNASSPRDISGNYISSVSTSMMGEGPLIGSILDISHQSFSITLNGTATGTGDKYQGGNIIVHIPTQTLPVSFQFREETPGNWKIVSMDINGTLFP
jgi:hypothetical protein